MSAQLCKYMCRLSWFKSSSILTQSIKRPLHLQCALLNEEKVHDLKTATMNKAEAQQKKQGLDKNNPYLVASYTDKVIVGCNCSPDDSSLKWFYLQEGPSQVCECGIHFKLDRIAQGNWIPEYSRIMQVDKNKFDPRRERKGLPFGIGQKRLVKQKA